MGGWMTYTRMRSRNGLLIGRGGASLRTPEDQTPYSLTPDTLPKDINLHTLVGDINRMERDYTDPQYPGPGWGQRYPDSDPSAEVARATGVPVDDVRKVMCHVFFEQR